MEMEKIYAIKNYYETKVSDSAKQIQKLELDKKELKNKVKDLERSLKNSRKRQLKAEQKALEFFETQHKTMSLILQNQSEKSVYKKESEILNNSLKMLKQNLSNLEFKYSALIHNCKEMNASANHLAFEDINIEGILEPDVTVADFDDASLLHDTSINCIDIPLDTSVVNNIGSYANEVNMGIQQDSAVSKDMTIFNLKNQLVQACLYNYNLNRALNTIEWKHDLLRGKFEIKKNESIQQG